MTSFVQAGSTFIRRSRIFIPVSTGPSYPTEASEYALLLHGDGVDESQVIVDSGYYLHTVGAQGNVKNDTAQSKFGGASLYFDGTGDYLTLPASAAWNFEGQDWTIEAWVRFDGEFVDGTIFEAFVSADQYLWFGVASTVPEFKIAGDFGGSPIAQTTTGTTELAADTWYHLRATYVSSTRALKIYADGLEDASDTIVNFDAGEWDYSAATPTVGFSNASVGLSVGDGDACWLDDVTVIVGTAVTGGAPTSAVPDPSTQLDIVSPTNLVAHYKFEEGAGTVVGDSSVNGNDGTATSMTWAAGYLGSYSGSFDGSNDYVNTPSLSMGVDNAFSISVFVRRTGSNANYNVITGYNTASPVDDRFVFLLGIPGQGNRLGLFSPGTAAYLMDSTELTLNDWVHCALTFDGTTARIYRAGAEVLSDPNFGFSSGNRALTLGRWYSNATGGEMLADLDDWRFYTRTLTAGEIAILAAQ